MDVGKDSGTSTESGEESIAEKDFTSPLLDVLSVTASYYKDLRDQDCKSSFQQAGLPFWGVCRQPEWMGNR